MEIACTIIYYLENNSPHVIPFQKVRKPKGVDGLIEINNPNRNQKATKKVTDLDASSEATLSRREREEIEKQQAQQRYQKLHAEGKTEQAQRDLARLAIIRKQREEAAKKKEEARQGWLPHL
jgi:predicted RNA-binding protein with RPS1 domain